MTLKRENGHDQLHNAAMTEVYPHPLLSCMMPMVALLGVVAVVLFGIQLWESSLPRDTIIPPIEGLKVEQATSDLQRAGLSVKVVQETRSSEDIPANAVISADPPGGRRVKRGRLVLLTLSSGSAYTIVPYVQALPKVAAMERLLKAGLLVAKEEYRSQASTAADRVIAITPKSGTKVKRMSSVNLVLSKGDENSLDTISEGTPGMRSTVVTVTLPQTGDQPQQMRIDVTDNDGTRTVYQQEQQPGEQVSHTVEGKGPMTIEVYFDDQLILTKKY